MLEDTLPPCSVGRVLVAALCHGEQLVVLTGYLGDERHVCRHLLHEILLCAPLVGILADEVHAVVAGIALQPLLLGPVALEVGRVGPYDALPELCVDSVLCHAPEGVVLGCRAV